MPRNAKNLCKLPGANRKTPKWVSSPSLSWMSNGKWWNCARQNGKCSQIRKTRKNEACWKGASFQHWTNVWFDDVPPLHQQKVLLYDPRWRDWLKSGNLFLVMKWRKHIFGAQIYTFPNLYRSSHAASYGELGAWPPSSSSSTDQTSIGVQNGRDKGVQHTRMYIYVLCTNINAYMFTCFFIYVSIYIYIYLSIHLLKYPLIYWLINWFNWCIYS